jgi:hypothetical protein
LFSTIFLVRTIIELMTNETYYSNRYSQFIGPFDIAIQAICKNHMCSESYEIGALCSVLRCNIRIIYPEIDIRQDMAFLNNGFTPAPPIITNCEITILWSHTRNEKDAREANHGTWSPNHFVPLMSPVAHYEYDDSNKSAPIIVVGYLLVSKNSKNFEIVFRLLKRRPLRTMLILKYEFLSFSLLLIDVYEAKPTWKMTPLNQFFRVQCNKNKITQR